MSCKCSRQKYFSFDNENWIDGFGQQLYDKTAIEKRNEFEPEQLSFRLSDWEEMFIKGG